MKRISRSLSRLSEARRARSRSTGTTSLPVDVSTMDTQYVTLQDQGGFDKFKDNRDSEASYVELPDELTRLRARVKELEELSDLADVKPENIDFVSEKRQLEHRVDHLRRKMMNTDEPTQMSEVATALAAATQRLKDFSLNKHEYQVPVEVHAVEATERREDDATGPPAMADLLQGSATGAKPKALQWRGYEQGQEALPDRNPPPDLMEAKRKYRQFTDSFPEFKGDTASRSDETLLAYIMKIQSKKKFAPNWPEKLFVDLLGDKFTEPGLVMLWFHQQDKVKTISDLIDFLQTFYGDRTPKGTRQMNLYSMSMDSDEVDQGLYQKYFHRILMKAQICYPMSSLEEVTATTLNIFIHRVSPEEIRTYVWDVMGDMENPDPMVVVSKAEKKWASIKTRANFQANVPFQDPVDVNAMMTRNQGRGRGRGKGRGGKQTGDGQAQQPPRQQNGAGNQSGDGGDQTAQNQQGQGHSQWRGGSGGGRGRGGYPKQNKQWKKSCPPDGTITKQTFMAIDCSGCKTIHSVDQECKTTFRSGLICYRCDKEGHIARDCPSRPKDQEN